MKTNNGQRRQQICCMPCPPSSHGMGESMMMLPPTQNGLLHTWTEMESYGKDGLALVLPPVASRCSSHFSSLPASLTHRHTHKPTRQATAMGKFQALHTTVRIHTHAHTCTLSLSLTHSLTITHTQSLTPTLTLSHTLTHTHSLSLPHTFALSLPHTLSHSLAHTLSVTGTAPKH